VRDVVPAGARPVRADRDGRRVPVGARRRVRRLRRVHAAAGPGAAVPEREEGRAARVVHQIWHEDSPLGWTNGEAFDEKTNEDAQRFALWAIRNQPLDYVRVVAYDFFVRTFSWNRSQYPTIGTEARYHFPTKPDERKPDLPVLGGGDRRSVVDEYAHGAAPQHIVDPYAGFMRGYQERVRVPGTVLGIV